MSIKIFLRVGLPAPPPLLKPSPVLDISFERPLERALRLLFIGGSDVERGEESPTKLLWESWGRSLLEKPKLPKPVCVFIGMRVRPDCCKELLMGSLKGFYCIYTGLSLGRLLIATYEGYMPRIPVLADALETAEVNLSFFLSIKTSAKSSLWTFASFILTGAGITN